MDSLLDEMAHMLGQDFQPTYILSGSGVGWYYSDSKRTMVKVQRGTECIICEEDSSGTNKYYVQVGNDVFLVPKEEVLEIGWN